MADVETTKALRALASRLGRQEAKSGGFLSGAAFFAAPLAGTLFFRTDLGFLCYYDGTRWLTVHEYVLPLVPNRATVAVNTIWDTTIRIDYAVYLTRVALTTNVATTNNSTNFWTVTLQGVNLALSAATTFYNPNTGTTPDTAGVETDHGGTVSAGNATPTNRQFLRASVGKTLTPGNLTISCTVSYRLIIT